MALTQHLAIRLLPASLKRMFVETRERISQHSLVRTWEKNGRPGPTPQLIKERTVRQYAQRFRIDTLIETGTYLGQMVNANKSHFKKIVSIELDVALCQQARQRFKSYGHISIVQGDSSRLLPDILKEVRGKCLFWLDGHYSGGITAKGTKETPIVEELKHIKMHGDEHVVLIDDARFFQGCNDYPTLNELELLVKELWPGNTFEVRDDMIRIHIDVKSL